MPTATNPVTDLPEGELVDEKLKQLLTSVDWAVLEFSIESLSSFRERYGFVAADDVLRAVTLMVRNAVREYGEEDDFIGHLGPENFVIITNPDAVEDVQERIERRITQSREYFYPLRDRDRAKEAMEENHLRILSAYLTFEDGPFENLDILKQKLGEEVRSSAK
jgi:GGDEF domain-containing protein